MTTQSAPPTTSHDPLNPTVRLREKASYALGDVGSNLVYAPATSFVLFYLTNVAGIGAAIAGTILLLGQLLNGVVDVVVGALIDKTKTRWGKTRPWILLSAPPLAMTFVLLFSVPAGLSDTGKVVWTFVMYALVMAVFFTASNVAYSALISVLTPDSRTRVTLTTFRFFAAIVTTIVVNYATLPLVDALGGGQIGWTAMATIFGAVSLVTLVVVFLGTRERLVAADESGTSAKQPLTTLLRYVFRNRYFYLAAALFVVFYLMQGLGSGAGVYYATDILNDASAFGTLSLAQLAPILIGIGFMPALIGRYGKRRMFLIGLAVMLVGGLIPLVDPTSFPLVLTSLLIRGFGSVPLAAGFFAIVADVVDFGEWRFGVRTDGLIYSVVTVGQKVGAGLGTALVGWLLAVGGYDAAATTQSPSAQQAIFAAYLYVPILMTLIAGVIVYCFRIEQHEAQIRAHLTRHQSPVDQRPSAHGEGAVDASPNED